MKIPSLNSGVEQSRHPACGPASVMCSHQVLETSVISLAF
jgi:hypothetical protein